MSLAAQRAGRTSGRGEGGRVPRALGAARRQLADRHQPRDVGDDAVDQCAGARPDDLGRLDRNGQSCANGCWASSTANDIPTPGRPRRLGLDRPARRRARRRRHAGRPARVDCDTFGDIGRQSPASPRGRRPLAGSACRTRRRHAHLLPRLGSSPSTEAARPDRPHDPRLQRGRMTPAVDGRQCKPATVRRLAYLARIQRPDGPWLPLWFGNQHPRTRTIQPTARAGPGRYRVPRAGPGEHRPRGVAWLLAAPESRRRLGRRPGTPSTIEETALAVEALAALPRHSGTGVLACLFGGTGIPFPNRRVPKGSLRNCPPMFMKESPAQSPAASPGSSSTPITGAPLSPLRSASTSPSSGTGSSCIR